MGGVRGHSKGAAALTLKVGGGCTGVITVLYNIYTIYFVCETFYSKKSGGNVFLVYH